MEPLIRVNDAFIVWPRENYEIGDIVMYRPVVLKATSITHRIIGIGETGYITKGDNSPYGDQESGEPEVTSERMVGRVVTVNGQPMVFPGLGSFSAKVQLRLGKYAKYLSVTFLIFGILSFLLNNRPSVRRRKPRRRLRLRHIYRAIAIIATVSVILSIYLGSRVAVVKYLVSEYPGTLGDQVEVNKPGQLTMEVKNNGLIPVWTLLDGIEPISIQAAPKYIWTRSSKSVILDVLPHRITGIYQGYVQIYNYPILLPRSWIGFLHRLHPVYAIVAVGFALGLYFSIFFKLLNHVPGLEDWIPLRAFQDKISERRIRRAKAKIIGRRRVR
jgi:signal peptidase